MTGVNTANGNDINMKGGGDDTDISSPITTPKAKKRGRQPKDSGAPSTPVRFSRRKLGIGLGLGTTTVEGNTPTATITQNGVDDININMTPITTRDDNATVTVGTQPAESGAVDANADDATTMDDNTPSATITQDGGSEINITSAETGTPVDATLEDDTTATTVTQNNNIEHNGTRAIEQGPYSQSRFIRYCTKIS